MDPLSTISTRATPQSQAADSRQVKNSAGGYTFTVDDLTRLRRFLVLGTDGPTYYTSAGELTRDNAAVVLRLAETNHQALRNIIFDVSVSGAAPKQNPTLFALAIACSIGDPADRAKALAMLPAVARTGTHLFLFARYVQQFRGWGRGLRRGIAGWYTDKTGDDLAYQATKYVQREGWSHRDLLRLAHPVTDAPSLRATFDWITHGTLGDGAPRHLEGFVKAQAAKTADEVAALIRDHRLSWEMIPSQFHNEVKVWDALLDNGLPQTALLRQLPRLTRLGMLPQMGGRTSEVAARLSDAERLRKARVHPINVLVAARTYGSGQSARGTGTWTPTAKIVDAMDAAFYASFGAVTPTGKRTLQALDVSGSMALSTISNMPLTPREASAAIALVTAATEPEQQIVGFTSGRRQAGLYGTHASVQASQGALTPLAISPRQRLGDAIRAVSDLEFGRTDCALPMLWAAKNGLQVDTFVIYTDSETYAGSVHPHQALTRYRELAGIDAKLVVVGMTSTGFSIADPSDAGSLDVVGFDSAVPQLIADFSAGQVA